MFKSLLKGLDNEVASFTKILQRKRGIQMGPDGSAQGFFYQLGLDKLGNTQSPEAKIAQILQEYVKLQNDSVSVQISVIESRVFGKNCSESDPDFSTIEDWIAWRLPRHFQHHFFHKDRGWSLEFYKFAKDRALEHFSGPSRYY